MKNLTKLALTGALIFGLNGCDKQIEKKPSYKPFVEFMKKNGKKLVAFNPVDSIDENGIHHLLFSKGKYDTNDVIYNYEEGEFFYSLHLDSPNAEPSIWKEKKQDSNDYKRFKEESFDKGKLIGSYTFVIHE